MLVRSRHIQAALLALILLSGCTLLTTQPPTYVIVANNEENANGVVPVVLPDATPTPAPPTPVPTPTIAPDVALANADRFLLNGYYEDAVASYRSVLQQNDAAPADMRASAAFGLGQAAVREGMFQDAVSALTLFIDQFPDDARVPQAHFLRGDAYLGLSAWTDAIADFRRYLELRPGLIDSYVYERIGDAQLALGQDADALASYTLAADASRLLPSQLALRERVAQVELNEGRPAKALEQYEAILAVARNAPYRASIEYRAAQTLTAMGETQRALARMRRIFEQYPDRPEAYQALLALLEAGSTVDALDQARVAFNHGDYEMVLEALNNFTTRHQLSAVPAELHMLLGRAYRELGNRSAAIVAFQTVIDQYPQDPLFGQALLEQGRTHFLAGDIPVAIDHYLRIASNYAYLPEAAEALWRAGYLYATNDQPDQARIVFERLADEYPDTEQAADGLFLAASAAYTAGDYATAERLYGRLAVTTTGEDQAAAYLTAGRLALQRGDTRVATDSLNAAIAAAPDSYYAARARDLSAGVGPFDKPAAHRFQFDDAAEIARAEAWLRETFAITQEGPLWPLSTELENDPRLVRGRELWQLAAYDEARAEFDNLVAAYESDPLASYQLAIYLRGIAAYQSSIVAAANVIRAANVGTLDAPPFIARMRYPAYYLDVVQNVSAQRGIEPLLMFALIRHESLFDTTATAAAGEKGLTQVIPSTGEYIASQLGWPDYQHSDLFRPYAGIAFGAYYLDEQLERFGGNAVAALAGYNAGPGRAASWLDISGGDPDLFMTAITIDSTRAYVQRIYSYYTIYRALYGVDSESTDS